MARALAALLLACACLATAAAPPAALCAKGLFASPASLEPRKADAATLRRVAGHLARVPKPYLGTHSQAYLQEGRPDIMAAMYLASYAAAAGRPDAQAAGAKAAEILATWARASVKEGRLSVRVSRDASKAQGDYPGFGLFTGLMALGAVHAYQLVACGGYLTEDDDRAIRTWLRALADAVIEGAQRWQDADYFGRQIANNHLSFYNAALYALGVALDDARLRERALSDPANPTNFRRLLGIAIFDGREAATVSHEKPGAVPQRGEIYDRYRMVDKGNGLYYAFFHLLALIQLAEAARHQGLDLYAERAETGESLLDPLLYYGEFLARRRCAREAAPVDDGPPGWEFYRGAKVEAHFWEWIRPLVERFRARPEVAALAERIDANACADPPPPFLPVPTLFLPH